MQYPSLWFSRHEPTNEQVQQARSMGFTLENIAAGRLLGRRLILCNQDVQDIAEEVSCAISEYDAHAMFGVFPAILLAQMFAASDRLGSLERFVWCYASASGTRGKGFKHLAWVKVGIWMPQKYRLPDLLPE